MTRFYTRCVGDFVPGLMLPSVITDFKIPQKRSKKTKKVLKKSHLINQTFSNKLTRCNNLVCIIIKGSRLGRLQLWKYTFYFCACVGCNKFKKKKKKNIIKTQNQSKCRFIHLVVITTLIGIRTRSMSVHIIVWKCSIVAGHIHETQNSPFRSDTFTPPPTPTLVSAAELAAV